MARRDLPVGAVTRLRPDDELPWATYKGQPEAVVGSDATGIDTLRADGCVAWTVSDHLEAHTDFCADLLDALGAERSDGVTP